MATINGMVIDNNEIEFLNTETSEINGNVTINGNLIVNGKAPINENLICDFCTGTEEQIEAMLEAHYRGDIDVEDYWNVGEMRQVHINAIPTNEYSDMPICDQDIWVMIIDFNKDILEKPRGIRTKAAITLLLKDALSSTSSTVYTNYYRGLQYKEVNGEETWNWENNPIRTFLNTNIFDALSPFLKENIKAVKKISFSEVYAFDSVETIDKLFFLSTAEVFSNYSPDSSNWLTNNYNDRFILLEGNVYYFFMIGFNDMPSRLNCSNNLSSTGEIVNWWTRSISWHLHKDWGYNGLIIKPTEPEDSRTYYTIPTEKFAYRFAFCL